MSHLPNLLFSKVGAALRAAQEIENIFAKYGEEEVAEATLSVGKASVLEEYIKALELAVSSLTRIAGVMDKPTPEYVIDRPVPELFINKDGLVEFVPMAEPLAAELQTPGLEEELEADS